MPVIGWNKCGLQFFLDGEQELAPLKCFAHPKIIRHLVLVTDQLQIAERPDALLDEAIVVVFQLQRGKKAVQRQPSCKMICVTWSEI